MLNKKFSTVNVIFCITLNFPEGARFPRFPRLPRLPSFPSSSKFWLAVNKYANSCKTQWKADLKSGRVESREHIVSATAYVDDTSWIARERQQMQNILKPPL